MKPQKEQKETVWNSEHTLSMIRDFYAADKPATITAHDIDLVVLLIAHKAMDHHVNHSVVTLAQSLRRDVKTIRDSIERLIHLGWLDRIMHSGASSGLMLIADNIPQVEPTKTKQKTTTEAKDLAKLYQGGVVHLDAKDRNISKKQKKYHASPRFLRSQYYNAQNIINRCDGDIPLAQHMIGYALLNKRFAGAAREGLYKLFKWWKHVEQSYSAHLQAENAKGATQ